MRPPNPPIWMQPRSRALANGLIGLSVLFYLLCFLHLRADFPSHSPWPDWSKITDEGWYAGAAIQHCASGNWYQPETFNAAPALPVWPALLAAMFKLTGVSMLAARVLMLLFYGATLGLAYTLMNRARPGVPAAAVLLLVAVDPLCYAFDRLAILEPLMIFWWMLALWLAGRAWRRDSARQVCLGVVFCLLVLTKTTGVALIPAAIYLLYSSSGFRFKEAARPIFVSCVVALGCWTTYYVYLMRSPYAGDYRFLFAINNHDHVVPRTVVYMVHHMLIHVDWIGPLLFVVGIAAVVASLFWLRALWEVPLFGACVVAVVCYLAFLVYHGSFEPRYYLPLVIPLVIIAVLAATALWERPVMPVAAAAAVVLAGMGVAMAARTAHYALRPEYSYFGAARQIAEVVRSHSDTRPLLLSRSGRDIQMFTLLPSAGDEFAPHGLDAVLDRYQPQWYAAWLPYEQPTADRMRQRYRLIETAHYIVFDDPRRNDLVLYRLEPR